MDRDLLGVIPFLLLALFAQLYFCNANGAEGIVERIVGDVAGDIGVGVLYLETGEGLFYNGRHHFPLASINKLFIALKCFQLIDAGELSLTEHMLVKKRDTRIDSGLTERFERIGKSFDITVADLLARMLEVSDNTAADMLLRRVGGVPAVVGLLHTFGFDCISFDRSLEEMVADFVGISGVKIRSAKQFKLLSKAIRQEDRMSTANQFYGDKRDTVTVRCMIEFLQKLFGGQLLSPDSTELFLKHLSRCKTGKRRIPQGFPGAGVLHKTGTLGAVANDVGIIKLPDERGHIALAVFLNVPGISLRKREDFIAQLARGFVDYMLERSDEETF
ncbi:MAG: serine hydrolase [Candidatus Babeliaceae bacterium]|nr:serine hydrolase [Candidatus Babeliaceae bacterium]